MTAVTREVKEFRLNGWTIRPCTEDGADGFDLLHGDERYHHDHLEVAVATAQNSYREPEDRTPTYLEIGHTDPVRMLRAWAEELGRCASSPTSVSRRALLLKAIEYIDAKHETIARLNTRAQEAEHRLAVFRKAVGDWVMEEGKTYVPLHTLTAIAKAVGKEFDEARYISHADQVVRLKKRAAEAEAKLNDEDAPRPLDTGELEQLKAQLARFTDTMPSWAHGQPMDYDAWLRDLVPDDNRLRFYQWIGRIAVREVLDALRDMLKDDPVPIEYRSYPPDLVHEFLDNVDPSAKDGDPVPSKLPLGRPFCDVDWHVHLDGGNRLPSCRLDSPE